MEIFIYCIIGAISGTIMGLLGSGAALIIIPAVFMLLTAKHIAPEFAMQLAIGTFFTIAIIMLAMSARTHHKKQAIQWPIFFKMYLTIATGTILGGILSHHIPTKFLKLIFACLVIVIALWLAFKNEEANDTEQNWKHKKGVLPLGGLALGFISGTVGIGTFNVPFLRKYGLDIRQAVATSTMCSFVIAIIGSLTYLFTGWNEATLPPGATGYIYWPVFLPIGITSMLFSPLGAKLAHKIPKKALKIFYCLLMIVVGTKMILS